MENKKEKWVMPEWMEKYRSGFVYTGDVKIEELMNIDKPNVILSPLIVSARVQVELMENLHKHGLIN